MVSVLGFLGTLSLVVGLPLNMRTKRIDELEDSIPDALKYMSTSLRAGSTIENSLKEVSTAEYGYFSEEMGVVLRQLREGRSFEDALRDTAAKSGSTLFQRVSSIIIDARKAGAGLAQVLDAISEDARDILRIKRERVSRTVMQVVFINAASVVIAPVIFGMVIILVGYISTGITKSASIGGYGPMPSIGFGFLGFAFQHLPYDSGILCSHKHGHNAVWEYKEEPNEAAVACACCNHHIRGGQVFREITSGWRVLSKIYIPSDFI